jgi:hypothetical protein
LKKCGRFGRFPVIKNEYKTINEKLEEPFMEKVILALLAMGMVGFWGCSSRTELSKNAKFPEITNNDYSTVYMFRESRSLGSAIASPIQINGVYLFRIGSGDCVTFKIPTGQSEIVFVPETKRVKFMSERGKNYYFYVRVDAGKSDSDFRRLTEEEWNEKQKACNWVELKKEK